MTLTGVVLAVLAVVRGEEGVGWGSRIAVVEVDGVIADDAETIRQIRRFRRDPSVKGFLVAINSPGGVVGPSQSIYEELRRTGDETGLPIVATIGGVGASGGYYVALAADTIFALPGSITGSIGVVMEFPEASELMRRVGVRVEVVKSADAKDAGSPFRPVTPEDRAILDALVHDVFEQFVEVVQRERDLPADTVRAVSDGRVLSGRQALERGLVDRLGNYHDALAAVGRMAGLGPEPRVVRPPQRRTTLLDLILGRGAVGALDRIAGALEAGSEPRLKFVIPW
jgi:protease-4